MPETEPPKAAEPGLKIGSYRILERLGSGGMSSVLRAAHDVTGHEVAVKVLPRSLAKNPVLLQRFLQEAKSAEALLHPNIVAIYDRGFDQGRYYLVLEYVAGGDLHDRVKQKGPLGVAEAVAVTRAVAEGLRYAVGRGVIHRDIKPANLLLTPDGRVKITDLGLALQVGAEDERVTRDGTTVGTVDYMAPEQARDSRATSIRSDIYSLGCTLYHLLAGAPPFAGGDVITKLRSHAVAPPPDVRQARPEVPEPLALLIQRMMAKDPEDRFADYDELIAALDALPIPGTARAPLPTALIDDEPPLAAIIDEDEGPAPGLVALVDDEEPAPDPARPPRRTGSDGFAPLATERRPRRTLLTFDEPDGTPPRPASPEPIAMELDDEEPEEAIPAWATRPDPAPERWVVGLLAAGLVAIVLAVVVSLATRGRVEESAEEAEAVPESTPAPAPPPVAPVADVAPRSSPRPNAPAPHPEERPSAPARLRVPDEAIARALPEWARGPVPDRVAGPSVTVRRVPGPAREPSAPRAVPTLSRALEVPGGTVELADCGPFFEDDFPVAGKKGRLIRASSGLRPIVMVEPPAREAARARPAPFVVDEAGLTLDGIDLIVDVDRMPRNQPSLFLCRGGTLTLHNCSVTVLNPRGLPFALVRVEDAGTGRPPRVRIERTLVRGASVTVVDLAGPAEAVLIRSALASGDAPAVVVGDCSTAAGPRRITLLRCLVAARRTALAASGPAVLRSVGSAFVRDGGEGAASVLAVPEAGSGPSPTVDWAGDFNLYAGWPSWLSAGSQPGATTLAEARALWPEADPHSLERSAAPAGPPSPDHIDLEDLRALAPEVAPALAGVAEPSPTLVERTVGSFRRQDVPLATIETPPAGARGSGPPEVVVLKKPLGEGRRRQDGGFEQSLHPNLLGDFAAPGPGEIVFETATAPWMGDLGKFLAEQLAGGARPLRVRVRGRGACAMSPVRLPAGSVVEILVEPSPEPGEPLVWSARFGAEVDALIDARGADLTLSGARFRRGGDAALKALIRAEDGHLLLSQCTLSAPMEVEPGGGGLVVFRASGERWPSPRGVPGTRGEADRPVGRLLSCLLQTGGEAVTVDLGRGVLALEHCGVVAGSALALVPRGPGRDRLEGDLWLDRCTIAAADAFVRLGPWLGNPGGPDRPWLVSSHACAFIDALRGRRPVLLQVDADAMARGVLAWQAEGDAYEVSRFTAAAGAPAESRERPGVRLQWIELWGRGHIRDVLGPTAREVSRPVIRLATTPLKPEQIRPGDLAIRPVARPGRPPLDVGADVRLLGPGGG